MLTGWKLRKTTVYWTSSSCRSPLGLFAQLACLTDLPPRQPRIAQNCTNRRSFLHPPTLTVGARALGRYRQIVVFRRGRQEGHTNDRFGTGTSAVSPQTCPVLCYRPDVLIAIDLTVLPSPIPRSPSILSNLPSPSGQPEIGRSSLFPHRLTL
jgi:hypothetical protein